MTDTKQAIIDALRAFIRSRPGFEPGNYSDAASYRADVRRATKQRHDAERMLRDVEMRDSITAEDILRAAEGGRLDVKTVSGVTELKAHVHYTAGQYYCTEYRGAVARLCAQVLWQWKRDHAMPETTCQGHSVHFFGTRALSAGDWLRASFRREYGRGMADRYFN